MPKFLPSNWMLVVNKTLLSLLSLIFLTLFAAPGASRAAMSNDFMALRVPDLGQAEHFFRKVMNCETINGSSDGHLTSALLDCGNGAMLELSTISPDQNASQHASRPAAVVTFSTPDASSTMRWIHSKGIAIAGHPMTVRESGGVEKTIVNFLAPWGQPMQLVSYGKAQIPPQLKERDAVRLASP